MQHAAGQTIGDRSEQQDRFYASDDQGLYIVADGMGGHSDGAEAAHLAVEALVTHYTQGSTPEHAFWSADVAIREMPWSYRMPGTTAVVLQIRDGLGRVGNIGDSRCYRYSAGRVLVQVTRDHNLPYAPNVITRSLGGSYTKGFETPDFFQVPAHPGDRFLLCSDALVESRKDKELRELLVKALDLPVEEGLELLLGQKTKDNNTVVIVEV